MDKMNLTGASAGSSIPPRSADSQNRELESEKIKTPASTQDEFVSIPINISVSRSQLEEALRSGKSININLGSTANEAGSSHSKVSDAKGYKLDLPEIGTKTVLKDTTTGSMRAMSEVGYSSASKGVFGVPMLIDGGDIMLFSSRQLKKIQELEKQGVKSFNVGEEVISSKDAKNRAKESLLTGMIQAAGGFGLTVALVTGNMPAAYGVLAIFGGLLVYRVGRAVKIIGTEGIVSGAKKKLSSIKNRLKETFNSAKEKIKVKDNAPPKYIVAEENQLIR